MPYPNEHAARLVNPNQFDRFTRTNDKFGDGVHAIWGIKETGDEDKLVLQALRFSTSKFTVAEAKAWLKDHDYKPILFEPAEKAEVNSFVLRFSSGEALFLSDGTGTGIPSKLFRKELIPVGRFWKESDGIEFEVTEDILNHWVDTFARMARNGIDVPVPAGHEYFGDPDKNRGYLRGLSVEDSSLYGIIELIGEDGIKLADLADVSLYCPVEWVDGAGNVYYRPILHVALTTYPVIPGLKGFEALAASLISMKEQPTMDWKKVQEALGIKDDMSDEGAEALILSAVETMKSAHKVDTDKVTALTTQVTELTESERALKLSIEPKTPDPILVSLAADNLDLKLGQLVSGGRITKAVKDKLSTALIGGDTRERLVLSLSHGANDLVNDVILALMENNPVELREASGRQELELSHPGGDKKGPLEADAERRAELAKT